MKFKFSISKLLILVVIGMALSLGVGALTLINLRTDVRGVLRGINGGTGYNSVGTLGQVPISDGTKFVPGDPLVSGPDAPGAVPTTYPIQIGAFDGTYVRRLLSDSSGKLEVTALSSLEPCQSGSRTSLPISLTNSNVIINGMSAEYTYICAIEIVNASTQNVALVEGSGSVCAIGTTALAGGTSASMGWPFATSGGIAYGNGGFWVFKTAVAGDDICLLLSGSGLVSGSVNYRQF